MCEARDEAVEHEAVVIDEGDANRGCATARGRRNTHRRPLCQLGLHDRIPTSLSDPGSGQ